MAHQNWLKKAVFKEMPLPFREDVHKHKTAPWYYDNMVQEYDEEFTEETAKQEELAMGDGARYLGNGSFNIVYHSGDVVTKYTKYEDEAEIYHKQFEQNYPCLVKVLEPPVKIQIDPELWRIRMEKVELLRDKQKWLAAKLKSAVERLKFYGDPVDADNVVESFIKEQGPISESDMEFLNLYREFLKCFISFGINPVDTHSGNIGLNKEGKLVLFDLGNCMD